MIYKHKSKCLCISLSSLADLSSVVLCFEASGSGVCGSDSFNTDRFDFKDDVKLCETNGYA